MREVSIHGLRVGRAEVSQAFERRDSGRAEVRVLQNHGPLEVRVEPEGADLP